MKDPAYWPPAPTGPPTYTCTEIELVVSGSRPQPTMRSSVGLDRVTLCRCPKGAAFAGRPQPIIVLAPGPNVLMAWAHTFVRPAL